MKNYNCISNNFLTEYVCSWKYTAHADNLSGEKHDFVFINENMA